MQEQNWVPNGLVYLRTVSLKGELSTEDTGRGELAKPRDASYSCFCEYHRAIVLSISAYQQVKCSCPGNRETRLLGGMTNHVFWPEVVEMEV